MMRGLFAILVLGTAATIAAPRLSNAGTIEFSFANETVSIGPAGETGTIDVVVTEIGSQDTLYQFGVEVFVANRGGSNITLNAALETGAPVPPGSAGGFAGGTSGYVFGQNNFNNSNDVTGGGQIGVNSPTDIQNSDTDVTAGTLLGGGAQYGLMQLEFTIPPGTPGGSYPLTFNTDDPNTDGDFVNTVSKSDFTHYRSPDVSVQYDLFYPPEPSSVVLLVLGAVSLLGFHRGRTRRPS